MKIPFSYILRNLWTRRLTTALTAGGMALVVFVFAAVLMLDAGLRKTLVATGSADNVILLRQGVQTEIQIVDCVCHSWEPEMVRAVFFQKIKSGKWGKTRTTGLVAWDFKTDSWRRF